MNSSDKKQITVYCTHCGAEQEGYVKVNAKAWAQMGGMICFYCKKLFFWKFKNEHRQE
jgi:hypothetical protein